MSYRMYTNICVFYIFISILFSFIYMQRSSLGFKHSCWPRDDDLKLHLRPKSRSVPSGQIPTAGAGYVQHGQWVYLIYGCNKQL